MRGSLVWSLVAVLTAAIGCTRPNPAFLIEDDEGSAGNGGGDSGGSGGAGGGAPGPDQGITSTGGRGATGGSGAGGSDGPTPPDAGPVSPDGQVALDTFPAPAVDLRPGDAAMVDGPRDATPLDATLNPDLAPLPVGNGLLVELWDGTQLEMGTGTGHDRDWTGQMINFDWGTASPTGDSSFDNDNFSMRFRGQILPAYTEDYTFIGESDEGVRLWIDDIKVFDSWTGSGFTTTTGRIPLTGRVKHKFLMEYRESKGNASVKLFWSSTSLGARQIVPKAAFFYP